MRCSVITNGRAVCVVDNTRHALEYSALTQACFYDCALPGVFHEEALAINTSVSVQNLLRTPELREELLGDILQGTSEGYIFTIYDGTRAGPLMEFVYSPHLMAWDVGPRIECGIALGAEVREIQRVSHLVRWGELLDILRGLEYKGCIIAGFNNHGFSELSFGFWPWLWKMYEEGLRDNMEGMIDWILGVKSTLGAWQGPLVGAVASSQPPFPFGTPAQRLPLPPGAERHAVREIIAGHEIGYVTARGETVKSVRNRTRHTLENMKRYAPELQYRVDLGWGQAFQLARPECKDSKRIDPRSDSGPSDLDGDKECSNQTLGSPEVVDKVNGCKDEEVGNDG